MDMKIGNIEIGTVVLLSDKRIGVAWDRLEERYPWMTRVLIIDPDRKDTLRPLYVNVPSDDVVTVVMDREAFALLGLEATREQYRRLQSYRLKVGLPIRHDKYGTGKILKVYADEPGWAKIDFDSGKIESECIVNFDILSDTPVYPYESISDSFF